MTETGAKTLLMRAAKLEGALERLVVKEANAISEAVDRAQARFKDKRIQLIASDPEAYDIVRDAYAVGVNEVGAPVAKAEA